MQPAVARKLGQSHPDASDVATDAWLRFHGNWDSWSGRVSWERFAYGFARNTVKDYWRRVERRREDGLMVDPRSEFDLEARCAAREFAEALRIAVAGLPARQKQVFELYRDGLPQAQIAARLDIARSTVAVTLRNARLALLHELLKGGYDWPPAGSYLEI
jgi:RNA polymerase sigma factor (sigma-70 family)